MGRKAQNLTGIVSGDLTVVRHLGFGAWECKCACGKTYISESTPITKGKIKSCGCKKSELCSIARKTHGQSGHKAYLIWRSMMRRCYSSNYAQFADYGGRGISVCERWHSLLNFIQDMWPSYRPGLTLERVNNNDSYGPTNCCWASRSTQTFNQRQRKNSAAIYPGVTWSKLHNKWWARITKAGKTKSLGLYTDIGLAIQARKQAELEIYNFNRSF